MPAYNKFRSNIARRKVKPLLQNLTAEQKAIKLLLLHSLVDCPNEMPELLSLMRDWIQYLPVSHRVSVDRLYRAVYDVDSALHGEARHLNNGFASCTDHKEAAHRFKSMYCTSDGGVLEVDTSNVLFCVDIAKFIMDKNIEEFAMTQVEDVGRLCGESFDRYYDPHSLVHKRFKNEREIFTVFSGPIIYKSEISRV